MRGDVHWRHKAELRRLQNEAISTEDKNLLCRRKLLRESLQHVAEVTYLLRNIDPILARFRRAEILQFPYDAISSNRDMDSSDVDAESVGGDKNKSGESSLNAPSPNNETSILDSQSMVLCELLAGKIHAISSKYVANRLLQARISIEREAAHIVDCAEKDAEANWIRSVGEISEGWREGGRLKQQFDLYVTKCRDHDGGTVEGYINEQVGAHKTNMIY